jgi:SAM-dependent methyltransferase
VVEIGSGSGQHAAFFSGELPNLDWQPSELDPENLASIRAWRRETNRSNFREPIRIDVTDEDWGIGSVEAIFSANLIHIAPWECAEALLAGARRHLNPGGLLILYGPFRIGGEHTAESNAEFDVDLRKRDPRWGVRDLESVIDAAIGLHLEERIEMPANNQTLVFRRVKPTEEE